MNVMKTKLKAVFICCAALAAVIPFHPTGAESQVFHSMRSLLGSHFSESANVSYVQVRPRGADRARIERRLGRSLPADEYTFFVARSAGRVDGYALFDEERGQHEMISFGTFFDARGSVTRLEVMAFREPYGDGIRSSRFRRQFVGHDAGDRLTLGRDVDSVSGSTLSARSACRAVERASVLLEELVLASDDPTLARR